MSSEIYNSMPEFDHAFSFKSYSAFSPLFLAHGLILEVGLFMFTDQHLLLFPSPSFTSFFFFFFCSTFIFLHGVRILVFVFGCTLGNDGSVDMRDEVCSNLTQILDS